MAPKKRELSNNEEEDRVSSPVDGVSVKTNEEDVSSSSKAKKRRRKQTEFFRDEQTLPQNRMSVQAMRLNSTKITELPQRRPLPTRDADGFLHFSDFPEFTPNLTPKEVLQMGSFGGTYFRPIYSSITKQSYKDDQWKEFPEDWFTGLNISRQITSSVYNNNVNTYKVSCGGDLKMWEESGWITEIDPYGWFQWYCRFYLGRRCTDDHRQISRALGVMGETGRWRRNLVNKCLSSSKPLEQILNDNNISPKVRQLLQHWGYRLTMKDFQKAAKALGRRK